MNAAKIKDFWEDQAKTHGQSDLATAPDHYYRLLEIREISHHLVDGSRILDVGCGNGYSTIEFAKALPRSTFVGIDYSESMIREAVTAAATNNVSDRVSFLEDDVLSLEAAGDQEFDIVISERCIINLENWEQQQTAILNMKKKLKPGGKLLLVENTQEGLDRLNHLRRSFGLHEIKTRWHNYYVPQAKLEAWLPQHFKVNEIKNIGNLYYIVSRVVYAAYAAQNGEEPRYDHPLNEIASKLPTLGKYQLSPNFLYVLTA